MYVLSDKFKWQGVYANAEQGYLLERKLVSDISKVESYREKMTHIHDELPLLYYLNLSLILHICLQKLWSTPSTPIFSTVLSFYSLQIH